MRTWATALCFLFLGALPVHAAESRPRQPATSQQASQNQAPQAPGSETALAQTEIDPDKAADIRRLLNVTGMKTLMSQTMTSMETSMRPTLLQSLPPGDYRDKLIDLFFERFQSKLDIQQFVDLAAAAYDKYLSDEDIKGLTQFYQTPLGQKTLTILPKLAVELQTEGMHLGEEAGRQSMVEVLSEHPDLAKALQEASQGLGPPPR
jgi:uncharacterized protein